MVAEASKDETFEYSRFCDMGCPSVVVGLTEARPCLSEVNCEKGVFRSPSWKRNDSMGKSSKICFRSFGGALTRPWCK